MPTTNKTARFPLARVLVIFSVLIMILNGVIVLHRAVSSYNNSIESGQLAAENLMHKLKSHVELTFLAVDLTLLRAVERQYFNALFGQNLKGDMQHNFMTWVTTTPQISAMLMTDENGVVQVVYRDTEFAGWMKDIHDLSRQDYFIFHKDANDPDLLHSTAQQDITEKDGITLMSRRLSKLNGDFGGVVVAAVRNKYLLDFFEAVEGEKMTNFVLLRGSHILINHNLSQEELEEVTGIIAGTPGSEDKITTLINESDSRFIDNAETHIISYENISNFDLTLGLTLYGKDIFYLWKQERIQDAAFFGMFALFALVISFFATIMSKQMQRVESSEETAVLASQAKSEFLANMSHELRTPLNAIIGFSEMLDSGYFGKLNAKQKERLTDINICGYHLLELINDVLEFSKGEAGKIELRQEKVHISNIIEECVRIMKDRAKTLGVQIKVDMSENVPFVYADGRKLKQILLNLLSNAVKFSKKDGKVTVASGVDSNGNFFMQVSDTGIGMKKEDVPKALSVFGQVHGDTKYGGTGLGLPLCKMFTELHGGKLEIDSEKDVGTVVSVILPAARIIWDKNTEAKKEQAAAQS